MKQELQMDEEMAAKVGVVENWRSTRLAAGESTTQTYVQRLTMAVEYPVVFTRGLFDPHNPVLADVLSRHEQHKRHRLFVVLDQGVVTAWPELISAFVTDLMATSESARTRSRSHAGVER